MLRPIRPYPLMPTLIAMTLSSLNVDFRNLKQLADLSRNIIGGETEVGIHVGELSRGAEPVQADHTALHADVTPPGQCSASFDRESPAHRGRQDSVTIRLVL